MKADALVVNDVQLSLGGNSVLRGVELGLRAGHLMGLIGPNGSGKTSLIRAITGLVPISAGRILVGGVDMAKDPLAAKRELGFAPDPTRLPGALTGGQVLSVAAAARGISQTPKRSLDLAERLGCARWIDRRIETYSLGTRQKFAILIGLIGDPPLLVLDEVMNGLDPISSHELKLELVDRCQRGESAVLLATHGLEIAATLLTHAALLVDGSIRHRWQPEELDNWRHADPSAFERAVVAALRGDEATSEAA